MGEELRKLLGQVDDDYLIGLGNKGILKRAYKDLEQESPAADWQQEETQKKIKDKGKMGAQEDAKMKVEVKLSEETCVIRAPLGESTCTCPSRSMCRHIVTAILWLKGNMDAGVFGGAETEGAGVPGGTEVKGPGVSGGAETEGAGVPGGAEVKGPDVSGGVETEGAGASGGAEVKGSDVSGGSETEGAGVSGGAEKPKFAEFFEIPTERLVKACGAGHFRKLLAHVRTGGLPPVETSSIVTVELPWEQAVVKLLEPLSYSSCTCHSKELCTHKAQALLVWKLRERVCTLQALETGQGADSVLDPGQVREVCESLREAVKLHLCTGLSRQSPEASVSMERLAVICHRAGLADMERSLRMAAAEYTQYFERQARFREEDLLGRLLELYRLAGYMQKEENPNALLKLAGTFRDSYELAGKLRLIGIGSRSFQSKTGYEGEIYYFLDEAGGRYLTWTDARPMFYEGAVRRSRAATENSQAPWGLNCSREQLFEKEIELSDARLAPGGRLSASQETKGELIKAKSLYDEELSRRIVWDYRKLLEIFGESEFDASDDVGSGGDGAEDRKRERLVLLGAVRWGEAVFDKAMQRFSWELFDMEGRRIYVSLQYTKEEKFIIRLLERMEKRVREGRYASLVLFGSLYLDAGRLCVYPIEFWLQEEDGLLQACREWASPSSAGAPDNKESNKAALSDEVLNQEALDIVEQYLIDVGRQLADLFVSGLTSSSEELEGRILACAREGEELGLHYAGEKLAELGELLSGRRHQMEFSPEPILEVWEGLQRYLKICRDKVSLDRARLSVEGGAQECRDGT